MRKQLAVFLALLYLTSSLHLSQFHEDFVSVTSFITGDLFEGTVNLISDNGQYLKACSQCGPGLYPYSVTLQASAE